MDYKSFKKFLKKYKVKFLASAIIKADDGIYCIHGKYAMIGPYDPENGKLGLWYIANPKLKISTQRRNITLAALVEQNVRHNIHQDGDIEFGLIFNESDIYTVADIINVHKRRNISKKRREQLKVQVLSIRNTEKPPVRMAKSGGNSGEKGTADTLSPISPNDPKPSNKSAA